MARGFLAGALQGGLIGVAVLAGLSLLTPLPQGQHDDLSVGLPVGSEFGRGGDVAPTLPAAGAASPRDLTTPAAVPVPRDEPAPATATRNNARPDTQTIDRMPDQSVPATEQDAPGLTLPGNAPVAVTGTVPQPAPDAGRDALPRIAPDASANLDGAPAMPTPAMDLSLPPDLTDLRRMERN